jgi:hypothetical protein
MLFCLAGSGAWGLTFTVGAGPAGSIPPYNEGSLIVYNNSLGPTPDAVRTFLNNMPLDALHVGAPSSGLIAGTRTETRSWTNIQLVGTLLFSLDQGDPFPIGSPTASMEEIRAAWQVLPGQYVTKTAQGFNMFFPGDVQPATEANLSLDQPPKQGLAYNDDVGDFDSKRNPDFSTSPVLFSISNRITLVPNLPSDIQTQDVWARFPDGGMAKVIDGVADLGLVHDGDGSLPRFYRNDDIEAMVLVNLDNDDSNNVVRMITYVSPITGDCVTVPVDLGDGILFTLDPEKDLPYANGGIGPSHFQPSLPTEYVWFSSYGGLATLDNVFSYTQLGLTAGDVIDGLGLGTNAAIPEPGTLLLVGSAFAAVGAVIRRRRKS